MSWKSFELLRWPRAWASSENFPGKREVFTRLFCCKISSVQNIEGLTFVQEMELKFWNQILQHWQNERVGWSRQELWQSVWVLMKYHYILLKCKSEKWMRAMLMLTTAHAVMQSKNALIFGTLSHRAALLSLTFMSKSGQTQQLKYWETHI